MATKPKVKEDSPSKDVAVKPPQQVAVQNDMFEGDVGTGLENVTSKDVIIPRLVLLQKLSPQLDRATPVFIEGAQEGDFCDTSTGEIWRDGIEILPCYFANIYLEWKPSRQGLAKNHGTDDSILKSCKPDDKGRNILPNGNIVVETATYYCLNLSADGRRSFIPLSSTQMKNSRRWMSLITGMKKTNAKGEKETPPLYYSTWLATAHEERNLEGAWKGWSFSPGTKLQEMEDGIKWRDEARRFYKDASSGIVRGDVGEDEGPSGGRSAATHDDEKAF